jgi:D-3-phosphoglycerate dehydrogenase / 2-oxoglutarate reductase
MMKIGISTSSFGAADEAPIEFLRGRDVLVVPNPYGRRLTRDEAIEFIADLDGLIAGLEPLDRGVLESASRLRAIARVGIGMDNVDQEGAAELGIAVSNTPEPPTDAVAEMTVTAALALVRGFNRRTAEMREARWEKEVTGSLSGAVVQIIGFGRIGRRVAQLLTPFGVRLLATDPLLPQGEEVDGATAVGLEEGLASADIVSLHAAGDQVIIGASELAAMKEGAILLNSARGGLVDQEALGGALDRGAIQAAWFDAFWEEPYSGPLLERDGFYGTPHVGTYTIPCRRGMEMEAAKNIARDLGLDGAR